MATRHRTNVRLEQTFAAADPPIVIDLPVNPLSFVDITLRGTTLTLNTIPTIANILATLTNVEVLFKGSAIIALDPVDLFILQARMGWITAVPQPRSRTNAEIFRLTLRVSFTRKLWWLVEGFPPSRKGELQLRLTPAATFTNVATMSLNVETEEVLDAQFRGFLKYTTKRHTPTATGEDDINLPIGNPIVGVLLFGTTVPTTISVTASFREIQILLDNQQALIPRTRWDTLHDDLMRTVDPLLWLIEHVHLENLAGVYTQNVASDKGVWDVSIAANHGYLDFDPLQDGSYALQTVGRSAIVLRRNADVADLGRVIPVELIELAAAPGAPGAPPVR